MCQCETTILFVSVSYFLKHFLRLDLWWNVYQDLDLCFNYNKMLICCVQVLAAIRLLLEFNADPHLLNSPGLTSLSRMLHIGLKAVHPGDKCVCVDSSQPNMFIADYKHDYATLGHAVATLCQFGSDPNFACQVSPRKSRVANSL